MVNIIDTPIQVGDSFSTKYSGTATTTETEYKFPTVQDSIIVWNYGLHYITATVGGKSERVSPSGGYYRFTEDSDTVKIKSSLLTNPFTVEGRSFASGQGQGQGPYNPLSVKNGFVYNADSGLRNWRSSLAKIKAIPNQIINVTVLGDSISEGGVAGGGTSADVTGTKYISNGYVGRVRTVLAAKYGDVGGGFIPIYHPKYAPLWSFTGTWTDDITFGVSSLSKKSITSGDTATLSFNGTGVSILTAKGSGGGTFNASVDGAAPISFNTNQPAALGAFEHQITGLADGNHTLTITSTAINSKIVWLLGAYAIKGTQGVRVNNMARWGTRILSSLGLDLNYYPLQAEIDVFTPKLTIIAMMCNDSTTTPLSDYKRDMQTVIERAKQFGDVLLVSTGAIVGTTAPQKDFNNAMLELALKNNCAFLDIYSRWGAPLATNPNNMIGDSIHPTDIGHQDIATALLKVIDEY